MQTAGLGGSFIPARFRGRRVPLAVRLLLLGLALGSLVTDLHSSWPMSGGDLLRVLQLSSLTLGLPLTLWFPTLGAALSLIGAAAGVVVDPVPTVFFVGLQLIVLVVLDSPQDTRRYGWSVLLLMVVGIAVAPPSERIAPLILGLLIGAVLVQQRYSERLRERLSAEEEARAVAEQGALDAVAHERRMIADDLHDMIAHDLTVLGLQADMALIKGDQEATDRALRQIADSARDALANLRLMMNTLSLASVGDTLSAGLEEVAAGTASRLRTLGHPVELLLDEDTAELDPTQAVVAAHILRECGTNIAKHSDARSSVRIECRAQGRDLLLTVTNPLPTGQFGASSDFTASAGQGSTSMASRAAAAGGCLTLGPVDGQWVVSARLPRHEASTQRR